MPEDHSRIDAESSPEGETEILADKNTNLNQVKPMKEKGVGGLVISIIIVFIVIIGGYFIISNINKDDTETEVEEEVTVTIEDIFGGIDIEARAVVIFDVKNKEVIYSRNPELQLPLASLSKIMTAYVASEYLNDESIVVIGEDDLAIEGDNGLEINERWRFDDLRDLTLVVSSNDGSSALASAVEALSKDREIKFLDLMNEKAKELGLKQTYFLNTSGLDIDEEKQSGSYGSAMDVAKLVASVLSSNTNIFEATTEEIISVSSIDKIEHEVKNTNEFVEGVVGLIGSKTGFTDLAGGNLVIAFDAGLMQPYVISVLGSSKEGRFEDVEKLYKATLIYLQTQ